MKILGEKSLSSKVIIGLNILFFIISFIDVIVFSIIAKIIGHIVMKENIANNMFDLTIFLMIIITGIVALFIIYQFIKIFKNLKSNILFSKENSTRLNIISNSCFIMSITYFAIIVLIFFILQNFLYYIFIFLLTFTFIFLVVGIGIKILNEIYKKAIEYKEENDFTI